MDDVLECLTPNLYNCIYQNTTVVDECDEDTSGKSLYPMRPCDLVEILKRMLQDFIRAGDK